MRNNELQASYNDNPLDRRTRTATFTPGSRRSAYPAPPHKRILHHGRADRYPRQKLPLPVSQVESHSGHGDGGARKQPLSEI